MINYIQNIYDSGLTIYDHIDKEDVDLYIPTNILEQILQDSLIGFSLEGLPLRTRSKVVKSEICQTLGYPIPRSFVKVQPRFPGQNFDVYIQKSYNVQIWNEEVEADRRYVFLQVDSNDNIINVRVITGGVLAQYDRTGRLTTKYQATMTSYDDSALFSEDSTNVRKWVSRRSPSLSYVNPNDYPAPEQLLPIEEVYCRLLPLVGQRICYLNSIQERNRGAELHSLICEYLGYSIYEDDGTYPDIANQLIEVKLQTSPTIDLGLHSPEDEAKIVALDYTTFYSEDIRYVIFDAYVEDDCVVLDKLYVVAGFKFTDFFPMFKGRVINSKIQLPLPRDFFDQENI